MLSDGTIDPQIRFPEKPISRWIFRRNGNGKESKRYRAVIDIFPRERKAKLYSLSPILTSTRPSSLARPPRKRIFALLPITSCIKTQQTNNQRAEDAENVEHLNIELYRISLIHRPTTGPRCRPSRSSSCCALCPRLHYRDSLGVVDAKPLSLLFGSTWRPAPPRRAGNNRSFSSHRTKGLFIVTTTTTRSRS